MYSINETHIDNIVSNCGVEVVVQIPDIFRMTKEGRHCSITSVTDA